MIELSKQLNDFLSGETLLKKMVVLPKIKDVDQMKERLIALLDIYKIFIPTLSTVEIYNRLYLSVISSLEKKNTVEEVKLLNENYKNKKVPISKRYGVIGGLDSFKILGFAGVGKTSTVQRCVDLISEDNLLIVDKPYREIIPILIVECVADGSFKNLLFSILKEIDNRLGTNYFETNNRSTMNVDTLLVLTSNILINHVCVLVIDEIERVANDSRKGDTLVNYLTQLVNQSNVAICFVGNKSANKYFSNKEYLSRRTIGIEIEKMEYGDEFYKFCEILFKYQYTLKKVDFTPAYAALFYKLTNGAVSMMVSLFIESQKFAIINGIERLTLDVIKTTFKNYFATMVNHIDIKETKITKKVNEQPIKLNQQSDYTSDNIFEDTRKVVDKDIEKALYLLKDKVNLEIYNYD